ncbi:MAG: glycyl-radical enzyme activating protein [Deltaproteobacteria bacterium]|nr:MAG: glycyl-radical enzyme activating protein [Deltaproteobacteria bacterium]
MHPKRSWEQEGITAMANITPTIFKIQRYCLHDGPGIRTTLFFQGCPLSCQWCHNPESQAMEVVPELKNIGKGVPGLGKNDVARKEIIGEQVEILVREVEKDRIFYDESGGGVTFSGGEPLAHPELLLPLLDACREREIHTCLDTSGYAPFNIFEAAATVADLVLFDIKIMADQDHQTFTGKPVGQILENLKQLSRQLSHIRVNLKLRFPLIPGITDTRDNIHQMIEFLISQTPYRDIHILPFHTSGEGKYEKFKMKNNLKHLNPPTDERVEEVRQIFEVKGFNTTLGG